MKKSKKILTAIAVGVAMSATMFMNAYAVADKIAAQSANGKLFEYDFAALNLQAEDQAVGLQALMFTHFLGKKIIAIHDSVKGYVKFEVIRNASEDAFVNGERFDLNAFLAKVSPADILEDLVFSDASTVTTKGEEVKKQSVMETIVDVSPSPTPGSTIIMITLNNLPEGKTAADYVVTVDGVATRLVTGTNGSKFVVTIAKTLDKEAAKALVKVNLK